MTLLGSVRVNGAAVDQFNNEFAAKSYYLCKEYLPM